MNTTENTDLDLLLTLVGHDLRGPVNVVSLASDVLEAVDSPPTPSLIARLRRSTQRIDRLIDAITEFTRLRFGTGIPLTIASVAARDLFARVTVRIANDYPDADPVSIEVVDHLAVIDCARVERAIYWILSSRIESGASPRIRCGATPAGTTITIRDSGPAIEANAFASPERAVLGLFLASEVARAHGGEASSTRSDGENAITLRFPLPPP